MELSGFGQVVAMMKKIRFNGGIIADDKSSARASASKNSRRPRVLHLVEAYGGGVQTAIEQYIQSSSFAEHFIFARGRPGHDVGVMQNVAVELYDGSLVGFIRSSAERCALLQPDVVHLHSSYAGFVRFLLPRRDLRLVYTPHCFAFERLDKSRTHRRAYKFAENLFQRIRPVEFAAVSPHEARLARDVVGAKRVTVLPNIVQKSRVQSHPPVGKDRTGQATVVSVGRISEQKSPDFFADVARQSQCLGHRFVWVGDGSPRLRRKLEDAGVHVTGWLRNEAARDVIRSASLYLHTAAWEGAPLAPLEATELGVPVIVRDVPSMGGLGYFSGGRTPGELADSVANFFNSAEFRAGIKRLDEERAGEWNPHRQEAALRQIYTANVSGRSTK